MSVRLRLETGGIAIATLLLAVAFAGAAAQSPAANDSRSTLDRVTRYVEDYYGRARSLMAEETVTLQHLQPDLSPDGRRRRLVYELRVEWSPGSDTEEARATVVRELLRIGNRPARPGEKPECLDPRAISPEPLAFLLRSQRERYTFSMTGRARLGVRNALLIDYAPSAERPAVVTGDKTCLSMDLPGRSRGRVWIDSGSDAILRLDEFMVGPTDVRVPREMQSTGGPMYLTVDRADTTTVYQPVTFDDPGETLMLPSRIDSVSVIKGVGVQRLRMTQEFRNYRRFLTESRIVEP